VGDSSGTSEEAISREIWRESSMITRSLFDRLSE
jgi:hypothetical protein